MTEDKHLQSAIGRPRSESARKAVLDSALKLSRQQQELSIKAIAAAAGVSRQTIYRWWDNRGQILLEALLEIGNTIQVSDKHTTTDDRLREFVSNAVKQASDVRHALSIVMLDAQQDEAFAQVFRTEFILPRRAALLDLTETTKARAKDSDQQFFADLVFGPLWYRVLVKHADIDRNFANQLAESALTWYQTFLASKASRQRLIT
jgi:AcrR family transcriptional regulator